MKIAINWYQSECDGTKEGKFMKYLENQAESLRILANNVGIILVRSIHDSTVCSYFACIKDQTNDISNAAEYLQNKYFT